jgi:hypothetical protein
MELGFSFLQGTYFNLGNDLIRIYAVSQTNKLIIYVKLLVYDAVFAKVR